jgi:hypothetical protein
MGPCPQVGVDPPLYQLNTVQSFVSLRRSDECSPHTLLVLIVRLLQGAVELRRSYLLLNVALARRSGQEIN